MCIIIIILLLLLLCITSRITLCICMYTQVRAAGEDVVWAPLTAEKRLEFDVNNAIQTFNTLEGLDYGYSNFLLGWLDTPNRNYPCLPPDFRRCLTADHFEFILAMMDRIVPAVADRFLLQALNKRIGTRGLRTAAVVKSAWEKGMTFGELLSLPELDTWVYNTTRFGKPATGKDRLNIYLYFIIFMGLCILVLCRSISWSLLPLFYFLFIYYFIIFFIYYSISSTQAQLVSAVPLFVRCGRLVVYSSQSVTALTVLSKRIGMCIR